MDASELARWSRFAVKGGIGRCTASRDCVAQNPEDLMFLKDDEIVVLMQVSVSDGTYLGYCEGVVGKFSGAHVKFHGKLKKPVFARRPGSVTANANPATTPTTTSPALSGRPIVSSPTPSDPPSSPFHLDKNDSEIDINTPEQGPSEQSHGGYGTTSYEHHHTHHHGYSSSSRPHTRPSSADKSPGSDSPSIETPARPSEDSYHQVGGQQPLAVEVFDEMSGPLTTTSTTTTDTQRPNQSYHDGPMFSREAARGKEGSAAEDTTQAPSRNQDRAPTAITKTAATTMGVGMIDRRSSPVTRPGSGPFSLDTSENMGTGTNRAVRPEVHVREEETIHTQQQQQMMTRMMTPRDRSVEDGASGEEPYSPASEYTKEGNLASEDSHIQRTSTVSDGGFGIGLSLLQGLANGDRDSKNWSESETDIESSFPKPPTQTQPLVTEPLSLRAGAGESDTRVSAASNGPALAAPGRKYSAVSEYDAGDAGFQWDDDDLLEDYRYSRYSLGSKTSKQSRSSVAPSVTRIFSEAPPLPEDGRPSLDSQTSSRSGGSAPSYDGTNLMVPAPLNIIKNSSREATPSPTTPVPYGNHTHDATPTRAGFERQGSTDDEEQLDPPSSLRPPASQDLTPKPSNETLTLRTDSLEKVAPSTSNDYNGDESELDDVSSVEAEEENVMSPGPLSPSSTAGSTNSLFLPHPGAPKPLMDNKGHIAPRTAAIHMASRPESQFNSNISPEEQPQQRSPVTISIPTAVSLLSMLAMAAERARKVKQTTVYGTTQADLLSSPGPVPIAFSLENQTPGPRVMNDSELGLPRRSPTPKAPPSPVGLGFPSSASDGKTSPAPVQPIPRANFFPSNGRPRPRSRSFSGFSMNDAEVLIPAVTSREEGSKPSQGPNMSDYRSSLRGTSPVSAHGRSSTLSSVPGNSRSHSPSRGPSRGQRPAHVPSPLSLPAINNPSNSISLPINHPLQQNGGPNPDDSRGGPGSLKKRGLRQVSSSGGLRNGGQNERGQSPSEQPPPRISAERREQSPRKLSPPRRSNAGQQTSFDESDRSELTTPSLIPAGGASSSSSSPMVRSVSLRSKLSISALRSKGSNSRPSREGNDAPFSGLPTVNTGFGNDEEERVQVKDMEFELVKPVIKTSGLRVSEDGSQIGSPGETGSVLSGRDGQGPNWRAESPGSSPATSYVRSPNGLPPSAADALGNFRNASAIQMASVEAHRLREQKWMTLISTVPSKEARKSKKIKKLLLEGVPSSVRGRVWGHITDSKARRMEGLFEQLIKKAPQQLIPIVEQDIERCFPDIPHLQDPRGSLANLLLAYTAMVPDIRYRNGLTRIAGHLLLQAPDEDAFWIFVAVMDSHLRGYYHATNTGQFEIDASLFQTLVESAEPELAQVLFNDAGLRAVDICGSWFSCLFAGVLPPDHLYRVWDMLLYEGPIYLFRVALALIMLCKRPIMNINLAQAGRGAIIELLGRPPFSAIPQDPESFINHTFTVKIKDDDLRKQRSKREAQWKKDRLAQR